jgi:hypothetical protein
MPNLTVSLNDDLFHFVKQHNEIRWSEIIRRSIEQFRKNLERLEKLQESEQLEVLDVLLNESQLTEKDADEISEKLKEGIVKSRTKARKIKSN